jgi:hypothetical protein
MADVSGYTKGSSLSGKQTTSMFAGSARSRGRTDNRGECLHTSKRTRGPQRSAKTGLHHGDATPSSKNQDPAQRVKSAETERPAKVCKKLQTNILNRVESPQSSCGDFPLATGLLFGMDK